MKKILFAIVIALYHSFLNAQNVSEILDGLLPIENYKDVIIKSGQFKKFVIEKDDLSELTNIPYRIYNNSNVNLNFELIPINSNSRFVFYILLGEDELNISLNSVMTNVNTNYLIFDKHKKLLFYLKPKSGGSLYRKTNNVFRFSLVKNIEPEVILLNSGFVPVSSVFNFNDDTNELRNARSVYKYENGKMQRYNRNFGGKYGFVTAIPYAELLAFLLEKQGESDILEICDTAYCNSDISRFFIN